MRVCGSCGVARPPEMFYLEQEARSAAKGKVRRRSCRLCHREEMRRINKEKRVYLDAYKTKAGCADCGLRNDEHPEVFDFDHRPGTDKHFNLARAINLTWKRLLAEIEKCDVVCANCHRIRTVARVRS